MSETSVLLEPLEPTKQSDQGGITKGRAQKNPDRFATTKLTTRLGALGGSDLLPSGNKVMRYALRNANFALAPGQKLRRLLEKEGKTMGGTAANCS